MLFVINGMSIPCVLREMLFRVAIRAKQHALGNLMLNRGIAAIRQGTQVEIKALKPRVNVMPR